MGCLSNLQREDERFQELIGKAKTPEKPWAYGCCACACMCKWQAQMSRNQFLRSACHRVCRCVCNLCVNSKV